MVRIVNLDTLQQFTAVNVLSDPGHIPGPVVVPNAIRVIQLWTLEDGRIGHVVLCGSVSAGFTPTQGIANSLLAGFISGATWTAFAAFISNNQSLTGVQLLDVRTAGNPIIQSNAAGSAGSSVSAALPNEVSAVVTLRTARTGPGNRGRAYIPGWATNALGAGNVISAAAVTALGNWALTWPTTLSNQGLTLSLLQPERNGYTGSTGAVHPHRAAQTTPITTLTVRDNHWDTQRRRGLK